MKKVMAIFLIFMLIISIPHDAFAQDSLSQDDIKRVILISIDSMNNNYLFNPWQNPDFSLTPNIGELIKNGAYFTRAEAVLPSITQVNHLTMVSGSYPEKIGFAANEVYLKDKGGSMPFASPFENPEYIKCDTIFKAIKRKNKDFQTAVVAGKRFVGWPIWADYQIGPLRVSESVRKEFKEIKEFPEINSWDAPDNWVMDNALILVEKKNFDMMLIHLGFLDPVQHAFGNMSQEAWATLSFADYQVGRLIKYLKESGKLKDTLVILTSDHGQSNYSYHIDVRGILEKEGIDIQFVHNLGGASHIFLKNKNQLVKAVEFLENSKFIDGIWYGKKLDEVHLNTPYTGDIFISLKPPYVADINRAGPIEFISGHIGDHSGIAQQFVPIIFFGPHIKRGKNMDGTTKAILTDIVPTINKLTNFPKPNDSQGKILPVIDDNYKNSPQINYHLNLENPKFVSKLTIILFLLSLILLIFFLFMKKESKGKISGIVLIIVSFTFASTSLLFVQFLRLYATIPGISPDLFLLSRELVLWGTPLYGQPIFQFFRWISFFILFIVILGSLCKLFTRQKFSHIFSVFSLALIPWIVTHLLLTLIYLIFNIDLCLVDSLYLIFWYAGLGLSLFYSIFLIRNAYQTTFIRAVLSVLIFLAFFLLILFLMGQSEPIRFALYNLGYYLSHGYY